MPTCRGTGSNRIVRLLDISSEDARTLLFIDSTTFETYFSFENDLKKVVLTQPFSNVFVYLRYRLKKNSDEVS